MQSAFTITGNLVNISEKKINPALVFVNDGRIQSIKIIAQKIDENLPYILPGFIDSHVHIESSMLVPSEFARLAVVHGTVATVSDPHEIANVCGMAGVDYMIENGKQVNFKFFFGAPSCVPATVFETAGAALNSSEVEQLLHKPEIHYLSEMMNFPGVLHNDEEVLKKIKAAQKQNKPVDGHAPGLRNEQAAQYINAGISTDHECFTKEEALDKLQLGMKIIIREGSAAKNFDALIDLLNDFPDKIMFCSDDKHPDSLVESHINKLCERAVAKGVDVFKVLTAACINTVKHYNLNVGLLQVNDAADFIIADDLKHFNIKQTYINGALVAEAGKTLMPSVPVTVINNFCIEKISLEELAVEAGASSSSSTKKYPVIEALDGQLITNKLLLQLKTKNNFLVSDIENDVLKIVVLNRYQKAPVAKAFIKNIGLKKGAIASSVAHDSHNIIAVGADDESLLRAINLIIENKGGISYADDKIEKILALNVAGLMSTEDGYKVAAAYTEIDKMAKEAGSTLSAPFMTLSFMALLVIPHLKLSDKGLFDGDAFCFIN